MSAHVIKGSVHELGGCSFCTRRHWTVYQIQSRTDQNNVTVRICATCLNDVVRQARELGFTSRDREVRE